uniref:Uncharacterized protein n=1 Tax=Ciona intestinalis TaxID=7719 RepID=F7B811_CIOIN
VTGTKGKIELHEVLTMVDYSFIKVDNWLIMTS